MDVEREKVIAALAAQQHGVVTRDQLREVGMASATIRRRTVAGLLVPVGSRTLRLASSTVTEDQIVGAACLDRDGAASHRTGAWKHGLMPLGGVIDITVPKGRSVALAAADHRTLRIHTTTNLPEDDVVIIDGYRVTSVARTLMGLASLVPREITIDQLVDLVSAAIETRLASLAWLRWLLEERRCRGRNGVRAFERALDARVRLGPTESWLERRFIELLDGAGLPRPRMQVRVARSDGLPARVDFLYEGERIVTEVLGYAFHRTPEQMTSDTLRANELQVRGFRVLQFTSRLLSEDPRRAIDQVASALAATPDRTRF